MHGFNVRGHDYFFLMLISVFSRNNYELDVFYKFVLNKTVQSFRVHSYVSLELCMCLGKLIIIVIMTSFNKTFLLTRRTLHL